MRKELANIDTFTEWLISHPAMVSDQWAVRGHEGKKWWLTDACDFDDSNHVHSGRYEARWERTHTKCPMAFGYKVRSGGASGGSCWGGEPQEERESYILPDTMGIIVEIVSDMFEDVSLREFYKNFNNLAVKGETSHPEYYGNRDDYATIYVLVPQLYGSLVALDVDRERRAAGL